MSRIMRKKCLFTLRKVWNGSLIYYRTDANATSSINIYTGLAQMIEKYSFEQSLGYCRATHVYN